MPRTTTPATLLRVFIGESDQYEGMPLHEAIVLKARELGSGEATVLRRGRSAAWNGTASRRAGFSLPRSLRISTPSCATHA